MSKNYLAYGHPSVQGYQYGTGRWVDQEPLFWGEYSNNNPSARRQPYPSLYSASPNPSDSKPFPTSNMGGILDAVNRYREAGNEVRECIDVLMSEEDLGIAAAWQECKEAVKAVNARIDEAQELKAVVQAQAGQKPSTQTSPSPPPYSTYPAQAQIPEYTQPPPSYSPAPSYSPPNAYATEGNAEEQFQKTRNLVLLALTGAGLYMFLTRKQR